MFRMPSKIICAAAIAIPALLATSALVPASAQVRVTISYDSFHNQLSPYGTWSYDRRWGEVWHPTRVSSNFRPYYNGHWVNTREYGWMWVSNERFGDITYHYGRWVSDPRRGWLWVPGYVWAPSWVVWRSGGGNIAWFPMPPGDNYYGNSSYRGRYDNRYGYNDWYGSSYSNNQFLSLWIVVGQDHFADQNYRNYIAPQRTYGGFMSQSRDATNYTTVNNYVVNRSIDTALPQQTNNQRFQPVAASSVIGRSALVTPASQGVQVQQQELRQRPVPNQLAPQNLGTPNLNGAAQSNPPSAPTRQRGVDTPTVIGPVQSNVQSAPAQQRSFATPSLNSPVQSNLQAAPATAAVTPQNDNATSQSRSQRDRGPATPQSERGAPVTTPGLGNATSQSRSQRDRGPATPQTPEVKAVAAPVAPTLPVQANAAAERRGNNSQGRGNNRAQDNTPADSNAKPADDKKPDNSDKKDNPGRGRGQN